MTTRRVRRTVRRSGNGINVVADVNAVISTGGAASSVTATNVTQRSRAHVPEGQPTRRRDDER
jgi:hypothetical protein